MVAADHALPPLHVVFRLQIDLDLSSPDDKRPADRDGLSPADPRLCEGDLAADGRYRFRYCMTGHPERDGPKWDGTRLVDWPKGTDLCVSDGQTLMVYYSGNPSAFVGDVPHGGTSRLQEHAQDFQPILNWFGNPNGLVNVDRLTAAPVPGGEGDGRYFEQSRGPDDTIAILCDPARSYLAEHWTFRLNGDLIGDGRSTDPFQVRPGVWRPRRMISSTLITKRFILSVQKDAKNPRDHMIERRTLEVLRATPTELGDDTFRPVPPVEAQWVYRVDADGTETALVTPNGVRRRGRRR